MTSELKQALDQSIAYPTELAEAIEIMREAAGLVVLLKEDCQTCEGSGIDPNFRIAKPPCPACGCRGWNPTDQAIEWLVPLMVEIQPGYSGSYAAPREAARKVIIRLLSMGDTK